VDWEAAHSFQRLHGTARLLNARVFTPLVEAAASRRKGGERSHRGGIFHPAGGKSRAIAHDHTGTSFQRQPKRAFTISRSRVRALPTISSRAPLGELKR
jgi:hypothetical protein